MNILLVIVLSIVQGLAELLPVSSSAHVIVIGRLLGWDASTPSGAFLLVMLHTGTMFAVLTYFWPRWKALLSSGSKGETLPARTFWLGLVLATAATGVVGLAFKGLIEKIFLRGLPHAEVEMLFTNLPLIGVALFAVGIFILLAGEKQKHPLLPKPLGNSDAIWIGAVQGLCLPFRGFSRSGATISTALVRGLSQSFAESFSFALAVILTPPVIARELLRLMKSNGGLDGAQLLPGLLGMVFSFFAGLVALRWLSRWLEAGRWKWFGYYCLVAAVVVGLLNRWLG